MSQGKSESTAGANVTAYYCEKCGKLMPLSPYIGTNNPERCSCLIFKSPYSQQTFYNYGWICPVCGRGNAPHSSTCACKPFEYKFTC